MGALDELDNGMRITAVGGHNAVKVSTIQVIDKNTDQMRGSVKASVQSCANISYANSRYSFLWKMERILFALLEDEMQKRLSLIGNVVS